MRNLTEEYGIEEDSRYSRCRKEAAFSLGLFVVAALVAVGTMYGLTVRRRPEEYDLVFGVPAYLVWGILGVGLGVILALIIGTRTVFRDIPLDAVDPLLEEDPGSIARDS